MKKELLLSGGSGANCFPDSVVIGHLTIGAVGNSLSMLPLF